MNIVSRWGNSLGVRLPACIIKVTGINEGDLVNVRAEGKTIILEPEAPTLKELVAQISKKNIHASVETGRQIGAEIW